MSNKRDKLVTDKETDYLFGLFVADQKVKPDARDLGGDMLNEINNHVPKLESRLTEIPQDKDKHELVRNKTKTDSPIDEKLLDQLDKEHFQMSPKKSPKYSPKNSPTKSVKDDNKQSHSRNHDKDYDKYYDKDYDKNYDKDYDKNYDKNYDKDYDRGYDKDYDKDYDKGYDKGYDKNYDKDYDRGYDKDYKDHNYEESETYKIKKPALDSKLTKDAKKYVESSEERRVRALNYYMKLTELKVKHGIILTRPYHIDSDPDEMQAEFDLHQEKKKKSIQVEFFKGLLVNAATGIEMANTYFDPFDFKLEGWGKHMFMTQNEYTDVLDELYEKYKDKGATTPPEIRLLMMIVTSGVGFHLSKQFADGGLEKMLSGNGMLGNLAANLFGNTNTQTQNTQNTNPQTQNPNANQMPTTAPDNKSILERLRSSQNKQTDNQPQQAPSQSQPPQSQPQPSLQEIQKSVEQNTRYYQQAMMEQQKSFQQAMAIEQQKSQKILMEQQIALQQAQQERQALLDAQKQLLAQQQSNNIVQPPSNIVQPPSNIVQPQSNITQPPSNNIAQQQQSTSSLFAPSLTNIVQSMSQNQNQTQARPINAFVPLNPMNANHGRSSIAQKAEIAKLSELPFNKKLTLMDSDISELDLSNLEKISEKNTLSTNTRTNKKKKRPIEL
jgi:hypothetical protein